MHGFIIGSLVIPLIFPKVPQFFFLGILRVPQLPRPLEHPLPLKNPTFIPGKKLHLLPL